MVARRAEEPHEQDLARGRREQIVGPHHVRDLHLRIVDRDDELVGVDAVAAAQHEIADARADVLLDATAREIVEDHERVVGDTQANGGRPLHLTITWGIPTGAGVEDLLAGVRRARDARDLGARAVARVGEAGGTELGEPGVVERPALRLYVRCMWSAGVGTLVPVEAEPCEVLRDARRRAGDDPRRVDVLDTEDGGSGRRARERPRGEGGPRAADVEIAGR